MCSRYWVLSLDRTNSDYCSGQFTLLAFFLDSHHGTIVDETVSLGDTRLTTPLDLRVFTLYRSDNTKLGTMSAA